MSAMTIILTTMLIKSTTSKFCNVEEHKDTRWTKIECAKLTSPSQIEFNYINTNQNFKQVLSIVDSNIEELPPKGFWGFPSIDELVLTKNQIHELKPQAFSGLINVQSISIDRNWLTEVPEKVFTADLDQLEYLDMNDNEIKAVAKDAIKDLVSLKYLHLSFNKIAKLEKGTIADLTDLLVLRLDDNLLTEFKDYEVFGDSANNGKNLNHNLGYLFLDSNQITSFVVKNLKQLKWIGLAFNNLSYLEPDSFAGLSELENLDITNNFIKKIPAQSLRGNVKLEFLYLYNNTISILEQGVFQDLFELLVLNIRNNSLTEFHDFYLWSNSENVVNVSKNLRDLDLVNNSITSASISNCKAVRNVFLFNNKLSNLKPDMLQDLPNMIVIDMTNNPLVNSLPQQLFQGAVRLERLYLDNLTIVKLPCGIFKDLKELKELELSYNRLEEFNDCCLFGDPSNRNFSCNNKLTDLFLNRNLISLVSLVNSPNMGVVYLEHNNISYVNYSNFGGLRKLRSLDLSNNIISEVSPNSLKDNENLEKLNLESNKISKLEPGTFSHQTQLTDLNINSNSLVEFNTSDLWNGSEDILKILDISKNLLNTFNTASKNFQSINLAHNNISFIKPGMFLDLSLLTTINLSYNNIDRIQFGVFQNLTNLQYLDLSHNRLKRFNHYLLGGKTSLANLNLSNNQINSFNVAGLEEHLTNLVSVSLVNNSFTCSAFNTLEYQLQKLGVALNEVNIEGRDCDTEVDY